MPPSKSSKPSTTRRDLVSQEILERAAGLFADRGFSNTTVADVAASLGMSRTALYHYVGSKQELFETLVHGLPEPTAVRLGEIAGDVSLGPLEQLSLAIEDMVLRIADAPSRFRLLLQSEDSMPEQLAREYAESRRDILRHLRTIIRAGVDAGVMNPPDERVAAFALLGMCNWVAWWFRSDYPRGETAEAVANELARLGVAALRADAPRTTAGDGSVEDAIDILHQDLNYLQRVVSNSKAVHP